MIRFIQAAHDENGAAFPKAEVEEITRETGLPEILVRVLFSRGIKTATAVKDFLSCSLEAMHDPFLLQNMDKAVGRIRYALDNHEKIMVYGDYDCDGLTAAAILIRHFREQGTDVAYYIPKRFDEGYGLNMQAMETIAQSGCRLLVTVDCGITALKEAQYANSLGVDVIITDHHQCLSEIPTCHAVINPKQPGDAYPFKELSGAGIAIKLVQALSGKDAFMEYLDLAAIGTVADIVPLLGENRIIAAKGIEKIRKGGRAGLDALAILAGIDLQKLDSWHISFAMAPRINACGRMGDPIRALELLITDETNMAEESAKQLDSANKRRQEEENAMLGQALEMTSACDMSEDRAIVLCRKGWSQGVAGIVAARLVEIYYRPVILLCEEDGTCTGSGRSITGIHMFDTLKQFSHLFTRFGGHEMAGGLTLPAVNVTAFIDGYKTLLSNYSESIFIPHIEYDLPLEIRQIDQILVDAMERLGPFGEGNENPVFLLQNTHADNPRLFGRQKKEHVKTTLWQGDHAIEGIGWRMAGQADRLSFFSRHDMIVSPSVEEWNGRNVRCIIKAYQPRFCNDDFSGGQRMSIQYQDAIISQLRYNAVTQDIENNGNDISILNRLQMDELVSRRLQESIYGTLVIASTEKGARMLASLIDKAGLTQAADYHCCRLDKAACPYNAVWFAPCALPESNWFAKILFYDGCYGKGMLTALMQNTNKAEVSICMENQNIKNMVEQANKLHLPRELLLQCFNLLKRKVGKILICQSQLWLLERLKNSGPLEMQELQFRAALKIFAELELIELNHDGELMIKMLPVTSRKDLFASRIFYALERAEEDILNMRQFMA